MPACRAPSSALHLFPDGIARSCCVNTRPLGDLRTQRLRDVWFGDERRRIVERVWDDDYSAGCHSCGEEVSAEGRIASYPAQFDRLRLPSRDDLGAWPATIGFYLSNACNLQCVQCNGESSSAIRLHRERRPALPSAYGDQFFEDLQEFLPHLDHALFAGGEPFLAPESYRVWDLVAELVPDLPCTIVTNGTILNARAQRALEGVRASIVVSLDALSPERFEAIRVGASLDQVLRHLDRFAEYTRDKGTTLSINHCLMPQNYDEFPALLRFAEERGLKVDVSVVRHPEASSLMALPPARLAEVHRWLAEQASFLVHELRLNRPVLTAELERLAAWAGRSDDGAEPMRGSRSHTVLMFGLDGAGPSDERAARDELSQMARDGVHEVTVEPGDRITATSASLDPWLRLPSRGLVGRPVLDLQLALVERFGPMSSWRELRRDEDRTDAEARFDGMRVRVSMVALREENGRADRARMLLARVTDDVPVEHR